MTVSSEYQLQVTVSCRCQLPEVGTLNVSVFSITLPYVLRYHRSQDTLTLLRSIIASIIYRSGHIGADIASYSYCS